MPELQTESIFVMSMFFVCLKGLENFKSAKCIPAKNEPIHRIHYCKNLLHILLLSLCLCNNADASATTKKQLVCVIGAGATGLTSTKQVVSYPDEFDVIVFEKSSEVGGLWNYTDSIDVDEHGLPVHTSMYKNLRWEDCFHEIYDESVVCME